MPPPTLIAPAPAMSKAVDPMLAVAPEPERVPCTKTARLSVNVKFSPVPTDEFWILVVPPVAMSLRVALPPVLTVRLVPTFN